MDLQGQAAGYGVVKHLRPYFYQERTSIYEFSLSPLGYSFLGNVYTLTGRLESLRPYYDLAVLTQQMKKIPEQTRQKILAPIPVEYPYFEHNPFLAESRAGSCCIAAGLIIIFGLILYKSTNDRVLTILGTVLFLTFPEMLVRLTYGPIGMYYGLCFLTIWEATWHRNGYPSTKYEFIGAMIVGLFLYILYHKGIFFPLALLIREVILFVKEGRKKEEIKYIVFEPFFIGFGMGMVIHYTYGLALDPGGFIQDHAIMHFLGRYYFGTEAAPGYLSLTGLWVEYYRFLGPPFLPIALVAAAYFLIKNPENKESLWSFWFFTGAVLFSLVDWKCTRHLAMLTAPLTVATIIFTSRFKSPWRLAFIIVFCWVIGYNSWTIYQMTQDFSYITPTPMW